MAAEKIRNVISKTAHFGNQILEMTFLGDTRSRYWCVRTSFRQHDAPGDNQGTIPAHRTFWLF
jgi:hypothetical protein